ncbi:endonuclease/exonuclease/phosphatase family protein [Planococcus sp. APC 4015]|nr:endonuclease/exonuclease/phosphatase family protein [Planococcus sp. APC 4015]
MPTRKPRALAFVLTLVLGALVTIVFVWPQAFGAQMALVVTQLIAFRAAVALGLGVAAVVFAAIAVGRRTRGIAAGLAVVLGVACAANAGILIARGSGGALPGGGDLTVVAWNTQGGAAAPEAVARLILEVDADIVSLPETGEQAVAEVARLLAAEGRRMSASTAFGLTGSSPIPTSMLVTEEFGEYRIDPEAGSTPALPSAVWRPVSGEGPVFVAAHPFPPLPWAMDRWRAGQDWVAQQCDSPDVIVAGDLNATVDHLWGLGEGGALVGGCRDAATEAGAAAVGTWPATAPTWLAAPIDHVLVGSAWTVRGTRVLTEFDDSGSDHRPVVAVLDRRP